MNKDLFFNGEKFISAKRAAVETGYAPDHVAALARDNKILAKRVGRTWYISERSVLAYKKGEPLTVPKHLELALTPEEAESKNLYVNGEKFVSAADAGKLVGYAPDHVAALARKGLVAGKMMGRAWYVSRSGILAHKRGKRVITYKRAPRAAHKRAPSLAPQAQNHVLALTPVEAPALKHIDIAMMPEAIAQHLPIGRAREILSVLPAVESFFEKAVVAVVAIFVIGLSGTYLLGAASGDSDAAFGARLANAGTASVLGSILDKFAGTTSGPKVVSTSVPGVGPANDSSLTAILDGLPATVPASLAINKLEADLKAEIDAYAKSKFASNVSAAAPQSSGKNQAPISVVFNQTIFKTEVLEAANAHTSAQSGSDIDLLSQGLGTLKNNGSFVNPTISGGALSGVSITGATFSGSATLADLAFATATGTSATTTNLFSSSLTADNAVLGAALLGDATATNATTTSLFAETASSTNLSSTNASLGSLAFGNATGTAATTTNFFSSTGTFDNLFVNNYEQNNGTFAINSTVPTGDIFSVSDAAIANGTLIHQTLTANAGNGETSKGQIIDLIDGTTAGGGYSALTVNVSGAGTGSGSKTLLDLNPGANREIVFDSTGALRPTTDISQNTTSIGTPSFYFKNGYFDTLTANNIAGTVVSGATAATTWTIGSTQTGDVNEAIVFQRNSGSGNALLSWNASNGTLNDQRFLSVNYPFNATYTINDSSIATSSSLYSGLLTNNTTAGTQKLLSLTNTGTGATEDGIYINNTGTGATALEIAGTWGKGIVTNNNSVDIGTGGLLFGAATGTSATTTNFFATNLSSSNYAVTNLSFVNATGTNLFATVASSTSLFASTASVNGSAFNVTSGGNVGIGITNPSSKLVVSGGDITIPSSTAGITFANNQSIRDGGVSGDLTLFTPTTAGAINLNTTNGNIILNPGTGNIGIGTTNPGVKLEVNGAITIDSGNDLNLPGGGFGITNGSTRFLSVASGAAPNVIFNGGGNVGIGTSTPSSKLQISGTGTGDTTYLDLDQFNGYAAGGRNMIKFSQGGTSQNARIGYDADSTSFQIRNSSDSPVATFANGGNVGIGTTNPISGKLQVVASNGAAAIWAAADNVGRGIRLTTPDFVSGTTGSFLNIDFGAGSGNTYGVINSSTAGSASTGNLVLQSSGGNVGIGFTNPVTAKFEVDKSSTYSNESTAGIAVHTGVSAQPELLLGTDNGNSLSYISSLSRGTSWGGVPLALQPMGGLVGIGTTNPVYPLTVGTSVSAGTLSSGGNWNVVFNDSVSGASVGYQSTTANPVFGSTSSGKDILFAGWNGSIHTERMRITSSGSVGIGTTNPASVSSGSLLQIGSDTTTGSVWTTIDSAAAANNGIILAKAGIQKALVYVPASSNDLRIQDGSADRVTFQSGGNVGIGTTNPSGTGTTLEVKGTGDATVKVSGGTSGNAYLELNPNGANAYVNALSGYLALGANGVASNAMTILSSGNVGVGTTNPGNLLDVNGTFRAGNGTSFAGILQTGGYNEIYAQDAVGNSQIVLNPAGASYLNGGNVGIGTTNPGKVLDITSAEGTIRVISSTATNRTGLTLNNAAGDLRLQRESSVGGTTISGSSAYESMVYSEGAYPLSFWTNATRRMTVDSSGNIGIGTTNPGVKLEVNGAITIDSGNDLNLPGGGFGITNGSTRFLSVASGAAPNVIFNGGGNVGIGTASPTRGKLEVSGTIDSNNSSGIAFDAHNATFAPASQVQLRLASSNADTQIYGGGLSGGFDESGSNGVLDLQTWTNGSAATVMRLRAGNVGIGITSPSNKLEVGGDIAINNTGGTLRFYNGTTQYGYVNTSGGGMFIEALQSQNLSLKAAGGVQLTVSGSNGNVGIGTTNPGYPLTVGTSVSSGSLSSGGNWNVSFNDSGSGTSVGYQSTTANPVFGSTSSGKDILFAGWNGSTNAERMRITSGGSVGIGITNPSNKLEVNGGILTYDPSGSGDQIAVQQNLSGANRVQLKLYSHDEAGTLDLYDGANTVQTHLTGVGSSYFNNGSVGIGTTNPVGKLNVVGGNLLFKLENTDGTTANQYAQMEFKAGTSDNYIWTNNQNSPGFYGGNGALNIYTGQSSPIAFFTNGSNERMRVDGSGYVGIGVTNPAYALDVSNSTVGSSRIYLHPQTSTDYALMQFSNGGGTSYIGMDNSAGSGLSSGTAYAFTTYSPGDQILSPGGTEKFRVTSSGQVLLGDMTGTTGGSNCASVASGTLIRGTGTIWECLSAGWQRISTSGFGTPDLAEYVPVQDESISGGEVVALSDVPNLSGSKPYDSFYSERAIPATKDKVIGVISTQPGYVLNERYGTPDQAPDKSGIKPLALAGRVPVRVTSENGEVKAGDYVTVSDTVPGQAMKATAAGYVLGQALADVDPETGEALVLVGKTFITGTIDLNDLASRVGNIETELADATSSIAVLQEVASSTSARVDSLEARVLALESATSTTAGLTLDARSSDALANGFFADASLALRQGIQVLGQVSIIHNALYAVSGVFDKIFAKSVHTDQICVTDASGETCVSRSQLDSMLAASGQSGTVSGVAPTTDNNTDSASSTPPSDSAASSTPATDTASSTPDTIGAGSGSSATSTDTTTDSSVSSGADTSASSTDQTVASADTTSNVTP